MNSLTVAATYEKGTKLGPYEILGLLGRGGMGQVYRALDTRLGREVALKLLPEEIFHNHERRRRFEREARSLAAFHHPGIVTLYGFEEADGILCLVMELVEGPTLADRLKHGSLPLPEALRIASQIAEALEAAHERSILHRDLKPSNIKMTPEGRVKLIDFGLAKMEPAESETEQSEKPTASEETTGFGVAVGTAPYMSPEQARGEAVDHRTDVWAFGCVLYEMLTGRRVFPGKNSVETIAAVLRMEPDWNALPAETSSGIRKLLKRTLIKEKAHRLHDIGDAQLELEEAAAELSSNELKQDIDSGSIPKKTALRHSKVSSTVWVLVFGCIAFLVATLFFFSKMNTTLKRSDKQTPVIARALQLTSDEGQERWPSLSPDGKLFVYAGRSSGNFDIYLKRVGGGKAINLTEDSKLDDYEPSFSPDGQKIAFRSDRDGGGIYIMGATGESVRRLTDSGFDPSWSPDGKTVLFTSQEGSRGPFWTGVGPNELWTVNIATGSSQLLTKGDIQQPQWSPNGGRIVYRRNTFGSLDIATMTTLGKNVVLVTNDNFTDWNPRWSPDGKFLYFTSNRGGSYNIWRVRIDEETGKVLADPEPVTTGTSISPENLSISRDGRQLAYSSYIESYIIQKISFDPVAEKVVGSPTSVTKGTYCDVHPDGNWLAFDNRSVSNPEARVISVIGVDGTNFKQITDSMYRDRHPKWSPDGKKIAFRSNRSGEIQIWIMNPDGSNLKQLTYGKHDAGTGVVVWSPDSKKIAWCAGAKKEAYVFNPQQSWLEEAPEKLPAVAPNGEFFFVPTSWSPNKRYLAGTWLSANLKSYGLMIYSFETRTYKKFTDNWDYPLWLNDSRRLLVLSSKEIDFVNNTLSEPVVFTLFDTATSKHHEILSENTASIAPDNIGHDSLVISPDNRWLYFGRDDIESDIWMLTLNEAQLDY